MSWRRFQVLVKGLSPTSATVSRLNADRYIGASKGPRAHVVATPKAAQTAFEAAFKPPDPPTPKRRKKA
jgi:hypothetical protein